MSLNIVSHFIHVCVNLCRSTFERKFVILFYLTLRIVCLLHINPEFSQKYTTSLSLTISTAKDNCRA